MVRERESSTEASPPTARYKARSAKTGRIQHPAERLISKIQERGDARVPCTYGTDSSAAYPSCLELFHALFLSQARLLSARDLQHLTWRLSCSLLEVGLRYVLDLAASHRLGHLCLLLHLWSHCSFLRDLDLSLKLFDITSTRSFQGCPHFTWDISLVELDMRISRLFSL